jgi:hypothetical protein
MVGATGIKKKYGVEFTFNGMNFLLNLKHVQLVQELLLAHTHTHTDGQTDDDLISLPVVFKGK